MQMSREVRLLLVSWEEEAHGNQFSPSDDTIVFYLGEVASDDGWVALKWEHHGITSGAT